MLELSGEYAAMRCVPLRQLPTAFVESRTTAGGCNVLEMNCCCAGLFAAVGKDWWRRVTRLELYGVGGGVVAVKGGVAEKGAIYCIM